MRPSEFAWIRWICRRLSAPAQRRAVRWARGPQRPHRGTLTTNLIRQMTGAAMAAALGIALLTGCAQEPAQLTSGTLATATTDAAAEPAQDCTEDAAAGTVSAEVLEESGTVGTAQVPVPHNDCD